MSLSNSYISRSIQTARRGVVRVTINSVDVRVAYQLCATPAFISLAVASLVFSLLLGIRSGSTWIVRRISWCEAKGLSDVLYVSPSSGYIRQYTKQSIDQLLLRCAWRLQCTLHGLLPLHHFGPRLVDRTVAYALHTLSVAFQCRSRLTRPVGHVVDTYRLLRKVAHYQIKASVHGLRCFETLKPFVIHGRIPNVFQP